MDVKSNFKIEVLTDYERMLEYFHLIQQLNPKMTEDRYRVLLKSIVDQKNYFQVACFDGNKCVGLVGVWIGTKLWCGKYIEVDNFIVDEAYRGTGVGKTLLNWVQAKGQSENCNSISLDTYVTREKAQKFYFSNGFKIEGFHMTRQLSNLN